MRYLLLFSFLIFSKMGHSQSQLPIIKDFNQDGIIDSLLGGDQDNQTIVRYKDGKKDWVYFSKNSHHSEFIDFLPVPEFLLEKENEEVFTEIAQQIVGSNSLSDTSGALQWLMDGFQYKVATKDNPYYTTVFKVPMHWQEGTPTFPNIVTKFICTDTLKSSYFSPENTEEQPARYGFLTYYGHNHRIQKGRNGFIYQYEKGQSNHHYQILETSHGLVVQKKNKCAWIFHTDVWLTRGPTKLRFPSIHNANLYKHYVILHQKAPIIRENRLYLINLKTGVVGQLRLPQKFNNATAGCILYSIQKDSLQIVPNFGCQDIPEETMFSLHDLLKHLPK